MFLGAAATTCRAVSGAVLGIVAAYAMHFFAVAFRVEAALQTQFAGSRSIPVVAALPLFVIWFGFGEVGRLLIVTLTAAVFFVAPLHDASRLLGREWTILRDQLRLSPLGYYRLIVIPGTLPLLLGAFRVTVAISFTVAVASEYMGAQYGIGRFLDSARVTFNIPAIFLALIIAAVIGFSLDTLIRACFKRWVHWAGSQGKA